VYFPPGETESLARALPHARLTTISGLDHTRPTAALRGLGQLPGFYRLFVRCLVVAAGPTA
jgi:hypothetical protein